MSIISIHNCLVKILNVCFGIFYPSLSHSLMQFIKMLICLSTMYFGLAMIFSVRLAVML